MSAEKKKWKISKIKAINYIIWFVFIICFFYQLTKEVLIDTKVWTELEHFDITHIATWKAMDYLTVISGGTLLLELIALFKTRGVDLIHAAKEVKDLKNNNGKKNEEENEEDHGTP